MTHCIVNIRGTSGSGKSTVARRVMEQLTNVGGYANHMVLDEVAGRERIIGHSVCPQAASTDDGLTSGIGVFFMGKYATDCGGCDSMSWKGAADYICEQVLWRAAQGPVIMEGLMLSSWGNGRLRDLWERSGGKLHVLQLTTPLQDCLDAVNCRRAGAWTRKGLEGSPPPLNPANTTSKWKSAQRGAELMRQGGMTTVEFLDREAAFQRAMELVS